jgi:hypothetical protein
MSLALESYKTDNGDYPIVFGTSTPAVMPPNTLYPTKSFDPKTYTQSSIVLYQALAGDTDNDGKKDADGHVYFDFKPDTLSTGTNAVDATTYVMDPFGYSYGYSTAVHSGSSSVYGYNPTFDLWSTGGQTSGTGVGKWITNW